MSLTYRQEKIINAAASLRFACESFEYCDECPFHKNRFGCYLSNTIIPEDWDIESFKEEMEKI